MKDDTISRKAALDAMDAWNKYGDKDDVPYVRYNDMVHVIKTLPSAQPRWILCRERPPEEGEEVFVYLFQNSCPYIAWIDDGRWYTEYFELDEEDYPVAWMPLPRPHKGE